MNRLEVKNVPPCPHCQKVQPVLVTGTWSRSRFLFTVRIICTVCEEVVEERKYTRFEMEGL